MLWRRVVPASQRHLVLDHILDYALNRHLGQEVVHVSGSAGLLDPAITADSYPSEDQAASVRCAPAPLVLQAWSSCTCRI